MTPVSPLTALQARASARLRKAFTLVEIAMAMGIVSFSLLTTLGVLAVGLTSFRESINTSVHAQITQRVVASVRQTDFARLGDLNNQTRYYDDQGADITDQPGASTTAIYESVVQIKDGTLLPGTSVSPTNLRTVQIAVRTRTDASVPDFRFSTVIARNDGSAAAGT